MTRRVLIVTSSYAPTMIADMHRARHLAWELPALGWEVDVLAPSSAFQLREYLDPASQRLFSPDVECYAVEPRDLRFFRMLGVRSISWRALWPLYHAGAQLMRQKRYDLVYITTAKFNLFCLGRLWRRQFGIPYVLDYHDPWVRDGVTYRTTSSPMKQRLAQCLAKPMEAFAVRGASGIVSVSPAYVDELRRRYGALNGLRQGRCEAIPFAAMDRDLWPLQSGIESSTSLRDQRVEIVYVGAGGSIMAKAFEAICSSLQELRKTDSRLLDHIRIGLFGTSTLWRPGDSKPLEDLAARHGLGDVVSEYPPWIGYTQAMELVRKADGLLVLGVDDAAYMPSKLFTYALSGKPLLACFRAESAAQRFFCQMPGLGSLLTFAPDCSAVSTQSIATVREFLCEVVSRRTFDRRALIADYLAAGMARKHARLFERVCSEDQTHGAVQPSH